MLEDSNQILSSQRRKTKPIFWCKTCGVPLLKIKCENCGNIGEKICSDLKPMFEKECKFLESEIGRKLPGKNWEDGLWMRYKTIWYNGERLFRLSADGKPKVTKGYPFKNSPPRKKPTIQILKKANYSTFIKKEKRAITFICKVMNKYPKRLPIISFSGGKDSTVVSSLVRRARRTNKKTNKTIHIFGNTTIEYPDTYKYIKRFRTNNSTIPFKIARSKNKFIDMCKKLEPPTIINHWCCSVFKTSPLAKILNSINGKKGVLSFEGIRRGESASRKDYQRIYRSKKVARQISIEPIIEWKEIDVWIYILTNGLDFNDAYKKGTTRVGCLYCPNNTLYTDYLLKRLYPKKVFIWISYLKNFAKKMGKYLPTKYVLNGDWKIRIGPGNKGISIEKQPCPQSENITHYILNRDFFPNGIEVLKPFGSIVWVKGSLEASLGIKNSDGNSGRYIMVKNQETREPLFGIQQDNRREICVSIFTNQAQYRLRNLIEKQIRRFQSCVLCGACTGICPTRAIKVTQYFRIDRKKCTHCGRCLSSKYLSYGCIGSDVLRERR